MGTTLTGGTILATFVLGKVEGQTIDLQPYGVEIAPGDMVTLSASSASSSDVSVSLAWADLF